MKNTINKFALIILFIGSNFMLKAQDEMEMNTDIKTTNYILSSENPKKFEHQFGFNATQLLQTLLGGNGFFIVSPYQVNYKFLKNTNGNCFLSGYGLRTGYGQFKSEDKVTFNTNNFFNSSSSNQTNFRIGLEAQKKLNEKWVVFAGIDYTGFNFSQEFKSVSTNPPNTNTNIFSQTDKQSGIGPVFGIQFNINKYITLNTELTFYMNKGKNTNTQENIFNGISNKQVTERETKNSNITIPAFVNLNIRL